MNHSQERIVVKIGTESLFYWDNGEFGGKITEKLCSDISHIIHKTSGRVALISSGAVELGQQINKNAEIYMNELVQKQYFASIGQQALIAGYAKYFSRNQVIVGWMPISSTDIVNNENGANCLREILECYFSLHTLPIINENNIVSSEKIQMPRKDEDNDKNTLLVARLIGAKSLYIITNTDGIYENVDNPHSRIESISSNKLTDGFITKITAGKSEHEMDSIKSKLEVAREAGKLWIETHIIDGIHSTLRGHFYNKIYSGTIILPE